MLLLLLLAAAAFNLKIENWPINNANYGGQPHFGLGWLGVGVGIGRCFGSGMAEERGGLAQ